MSKLLTATALLASTFVFSASVVAQEVQSRDLIGEKAFQQDLNKSLDALKEVQSIYGGAPGGNLTDDQLKAIQSILKNTQNSALSIYDDKVVYGDKVIYSLIGKDDRLNYYKANAREQAASKSVSVIVNTSDLLETDDPETYNLPSSPVGLCTSERFNSEPAPGNCSGFRVGSDLIATAGHCIKSKVQCSRSSFVFGFAMTDANDKPHKGIKKSDVYSCKSIIDGELNGPDQSDWRVVRVDRKMSENIPKVEVRKNGKIDTGDQITVIGHPMGLPLKVTPGGTVRAHRSSYFVANPDTYGGNSGSPVFNSQELKNGRNLVEGILVRGEDDFIQFEPCMKSKRCEEHGCRGEDITYASEFISAISQN